MGERIAVVLFNLGGPDSPDAVRPFLFNLFNDPAIISLANPARWLLAQFISRRRAPVARAIYEQIGGKSPLKANTEAQAEALTEALGDLGTVECFVAMRYWHPFTSETARAVKEFAPDRIILLPLYPQYSGTTVGSSLKEWSRQASVAGIEVPTATICCYPINSGFITAVGDTIRQSVKASGFDLSGVRVLFSAHGLPKKIVTAGDPYQWQIEQSAAKVVETLEPELTDWVICYQSRVGRLEWIGPSTDDELKRAADDNKPVVVVPIAFVSEHSETLVEIEIEYRELAEKLGVPGFVRVPTVGTADAFIEGLAAMVRTAVSEDEHLAPEGKGSRICPNMFGRCPCRASGVSGGV